MPIRLKREMNARIYGLIPWFADFHRFPYYILLLPRP